MTVSEIQSVIDSKTFNVLTREQIDSFMKYGFLRLPRAIPLENCDRWTEHIWERLGMDPDDKSTWRTERNHMAKLDVIPAREIAPLAWAAICELCGGEDKIAKGGEMWTNGFIVNLGSEEVQGKVTPPKELDQWHVDGDFFVHFLDSPEQALLVIPCWSDVESNGGATWICDQGPKRIGKHLFDHPEGLSPPLKGRNEPYEPYASYEFCIETARDCPDDSFHEMTGKKGDVVLMHPLMLHTMSRNGRRLKRIISNPPVSLAAPFEFNRANRTDHSLIELKTIQDVGGGFEKFQNWKITGKRERFPPLTSSSKEKTRDLEIERLRKLGIPVGEPISQTPHSMLHAS